MSKKADQFDERYFVALQRHVGRTRGGASGGRALGRAALAEGVDAGSIARAHSRALERLRPKSAGPNAASRRSEPFLSSVLRPLEAAYQALRGRAGREGDLATSLQRATGKLADAEVGLRREKTRTGRAHADLARAVLLQRQLLARSRVSQEQLRRMTRRVLSVQEEERKRISRELHDEIAQILTGINVQLAILKQASSAEDRKLRQRIARAQRFLEKSVTAVHRFARELRPAVLDDLGLVPALRSLVRSISAAGTLQVCFAAEPGVEVLDGAKRTALFRVAQEALTNVTRHASAQRVAVQLTKRRGRITLEIRDDGCAFDVERALRSSARSRLGLVGMRERMEMVGGSLAIVSTSGKGTIVTATVPYTKRPRATSA
ncbi:MAG TPA: sensor histidine kinase [Opitutaceae bacterium]|nr:sensor histidine kinase [Opitutaceae bacterium]